MKFFFILLALMVACGSDDRELLLAARPLSPVTEDKPVADDPINHENNNADDNRQTEPSEPVFSCIKGLSYYQSLMVDFNEEAEIFAETCKKATQAQIAEVELGHNKYDDFMNRCYAETNNSCWCDQLVRPNPHSINAFYCTYPTTMLHRLIHPSESTWKYAIEAVKIVQDLVAMGIGVTMIYNWWRPEPYNDNVGGSATRHPFGTSIDVQFDNKNEQDKAHLELCKMRRQGRLRALGYYGSPSLHFGVGDKTANTWGKSCP